MKERLNDLYEYLKEKKYKDIAIFDLSKEEQTFDYGIILSTPSVAYNKRLACALMEDFGMEKYPEGFNKGEWIVFDFDKIVINSFIPQAREKYNLDKLWQSKKMIF